METKKGSFGKSFLSKRFVVVAIALCSALLVALPTIAAEDDFVLDIYGNANEDDTIDMRDLTYVKLIFFGEKQETEFADAKYDGEINPLDFVQIKLVIVGKENELTLVDSTDRIVTVKKPVERIIPYMPPIAEAIQVLDAVDKVVGVSGIMTGEYKKADKSRSFPVLSKLPSTGVPIPEMDYEAVLSLNPDLVIIYGCGLGADETQVKLPGVPVVCLSFTGYRNMMKEEIQKLGYILDKEAEAEEYLDFYEGCINEIAEKTEKLSEEDKPRVYYEYSDFLTVNKNMPEDLLIVTAGGRNIAADLPASGYGSVTVDPEWVVEQNPDAILVNAWVGVKGAYSTEDPSGMKEVRDNVMNRLELANLAAVKNGKVFIGHYDLAISPSWVVALAYFAKQLHPDLFDDLDPQAIHQEYVDQFKRIDFNVYEDGVFVYPPLED